jgi:hypothetical protein
MGETTTKRKTPARAKIGIYEALMNFQSEMPTLPQNTKGYGYTYTDLLTIINTAQPILAKHGLVITQPIAGTKINTILHHIPSKEEICSFVDIPQDVSLKGQNTFQVYGSALTYFRRYSYISILSIVSDADLDASGTEVKPSKVSNALPTLSDSDFQKLLGAFGKEDKNGNLIDDDYAVKRYSLSPIQAKTIKEASNG